MLSGFRALWRRARDFFGALSCTFASLRSLTTSAKTVHRTVFFRRQVCSLLVRIPLFIFANAKSRPCDLLFVLAESKGFEPSNTRLDVTRFPIVLLRPARTTLHIQRALGASAYSLLIQDLVVRGELIQLFLKLILGLLLRGGDGIMAGEATVAKIESGLLRKFVSRFYTKIPQAVNP